MDDSSDRTCPWHCHQQRFQALTSASTGTRAIPFLFSLMGITFLWHKPGSPCSDPFFRKWIIWQTFFLTSHHHPQSLGHWLRGCSHETTEFLKTAEMLRNSTLDDTSPLISYSSGWSVQSPSDPQLSSFLGSTYHATQTNGSSANITFNGMLFCLV